MKGFKFCKHNCLIVWLIALLAQETGFAQTAQYLPKQDFKPLKINVNLVILQRQDGSGNFQDNAADRIFLRNMISATNGVFADLTNRNEEYFPGKNLPFLPNAKLEIIPNIIFVKDEIGWNNRNDTNFAGVPYLSGWYLDSLDQQIYNDTTRQKAINLYFTSDGKLHEQMAVSGTTTDYDRLVFFKQHAASEIPELQAKFQPYGEYHSMRCHVGNVWLKLWWKRNVLHEPDWTMEYEAGKSIAHELGHLMGLGHTPDNHTHALMRTRFGGFRDYMTAQEIARVHQVFGQYPSLWQFVADSVTYGGLSSALVVSTDETWKENRRIYSNIIIKPGAALTIASEILMPPDGVIFVEKDATLLIDGGIARRITTPAPDAFSEAELLAARKNIQSVYHRNHIGYFGQAGKVRLEEGGMIERALLNTGLQH